MLLAYDSTLEKVLTNLKAVLKASSLLSSIKTVKVGLIDERDELPMIMAFPITEVVRTNYSNGLYIVDRTINLEVVNSAYNIEEVDKTLRVFNASIGKLFNPDSELWRLAGLDGLTQAFDFNIKRAIVSEPTQEKSGYTQFSTIPLEFSSYITVATGNPPETIIETSHDDFINFLFALIKAQFPSTFKTFWKDSVFPTSIENLPAIGVFVEEPEEEKASESSTTFTDLVVTFRVYTSVATREIAFLNHIRNLETLKRWIFSNPYLNGYTQNFRLDSIDFGLEVLNKPFKGGTQELPVFRSDVTATCSLMDFSTTH